MPIQAYSQQSCCYLNWHCVNLITIWMTTESRRRLNRCNSASSQCFHSASLMIMVRCVPSCTCNSIKPYNSDITLWCLSKVSFDLFMFSIPVLIYFNHRGDRWGKLSLIPFGSHEIYTEKHIFSNNMRSKCNRSTAVGYQFFSLWSVCVL